MNAPASIPKSQLRQLSAKITVKIGDSGIVFSWAFIKKSGNDAFDKMIEMTLKQFMITGTQRFQKPPEQWTLIPITITVEGKDL